MSQADGLPLHAVLVSVSNNGQVTSQSAQQLFLAHNPICFDCRLDANNTKDGTCKKEVNTGKLNKLQSVVQILYILVHDC
ncbi:hypothetical protein DPMN_098245 [Dreissena polymorpha]|uniref:Uncharacterized protein n=1 Tax=Dreissena polymorpha TaxID=45954 RepID=A0A9D4R736_DREPO|nr:hypothetical protein DPMN_098245 [Dreissena polymorpha]